MGYNGKTVKNYKTLDEQPVDIPTPIDVEPAPTE